MVDAEIYMIYSIDYVQEVPSIVHVFIQTFVLFTFSSRLELAS